MKEFDKLDKIDHNIRSLANDMHNVKEIILVKDKEKKELEKKDKKRQDSLNKAQKKFFNISTNLKEKENEMLQNRLKELNMSKSAYLKKLLDDDFEKAKKEKESNT